MTSRWCNAVPVLEELTLATMSKNFIMSCWKDAQHEGVHEVILPGMKFGYFGRLQWFDAFPEMRSPLEDQVFDAEKGYWVPRNG